MANGDGDLDPLWQDLDWYVPGAATRHANTAY